MFSAVTCGRLRNDGPGYFIIFAACYFMLSVTIYISVHKLQKGFTQYKMFKQTSLMLQKYFEMHLLTVH